MTSTTIGRRLSGNSIFVYLLSNASTDIAIHNNFTHFRNYLAEPLRLSREEHWYVSLSSIYMSNVSYDNENENCALDIICPQIEQSN